jgi:hypothetical protein
MHFRQRIDQAEIHRPEELQLALEHRRVLQRCQEELAEFAVDVADIGEEGSEAKR